MQICDWNWRQVVDEVVLSRLNGVAFGFSERARLAGCAVTALPTLPLEPRARDLFRLVAERDLGVLEGMCIDAGDDIPAPSLFTIGRGAFLSSQMVVEIEDVAMATCLALHRGERGAATDGLFALATAKVPSQANDDPLKRFFCQAVAHLTTLLSCFPDAHAERTLMLAERVVARGGP